MSEGGTSVTQHRWVALGGAPMTADQAEEWAGLTGIGVAETSLEVFFSSMICAVCLEQFDEALPLCPGLAEGDENAHVWQAFFTAPATQEEAAAWADPDGDYHSGRPQSIAVHCVLCGATPENPGEECEERSFWTKESSLDIAVDDFDQTSVDSGERVPQFRKLSDQDGDLHIVADPSEGDADKWRVFAIKADRSREEVGKTEFWSTGFGEHEGRPGWYAEGFENYEMEIEIPGRATPYRTSGGRNLQMYEGPPLGEHFQEALVYADDLHKTQTLKGGEIPYVGHLLIVAGTVIEWGGSENQAIAAVLHDAIEDQPDKMPEGEIRRRFDDEVVEMVLGLSDADVIPKPSWLERKKAYFKRLRRAPAEVVLISVADKLHNARAILSDFVSEGDSLWSRFSVSDQGALPQIWYFKNLLEIYESRLDRRFTWELRATLEELARRAELSLEDLPEPAQS